MSKKITYPVAILVLVLGAAPLALAQQSSGTQPAGGAQLPASHQTQPTNSSTQPAPGSQQGSLSPTAGLMSLNRNNQLVIDCPAVSKALAQPGLTQAEQTGLQDLAQLCKVGGFAPANSGEGNQPSSNGTGSTPPQQSQSATTPTNTMGNSGSSMNGMGSMQPSQTQAT